MKAKPITFLSNGMPLNGLGCDCQRGLMGVADYDILVIGGKQYSAGEIQDVQLTAVKDTPVFRDARGTVPYRTIPKGQIIGKVYSYLKATGSQGKASLMFYDGPNYTGTPYYALDESAIDTGALKDMGVKTVQEQVKDEAEQAEKDNDPIMYYVKKVGIPLAIGAGLVILAATYGKTFIMAELSKRKKAAA